MTAEHAAENLYAVAHQEAERASYPGTKVLGVPEPGCGGRAFQGPFLSICHLHTSPANGSTVFKTAPLDGSPEFKA